MLAPLARVARRAMEARDASRRRRARAARARARAARRRREATTTRRARVVVVGGGAAGVACARALAATRDVTLFDGGRALGGRASTRAGEDGAWEHGARFVDVERERERRTRRRRRRRSGRVDARQSARGRVRNDGKARWWRCAADAR